MRKSVKAWLAVLFTLFAAASSSAQAPQDYVGEWSVEGGPLGACKITLSGQAMGGVLKATTYTCAGPMSFAWAWAPTADGIVITGTGNAQIAAFSASRGALVGRAHDGSLLTLRPLSGQRFARGDGAPLPGLPFPMPFPGAEAGQSKDCYLRADTGRCASKRDSAPPPSNRQSFVRATHDINVRRAVDMSSPIIGQLRQGQCFTVNGCQDSRWGLRCEVQVDRAGNVGYTIKHYEQDGRRYIAFTNECR
ncbi:AprI/Inh family metalloprotease inhibitor [Rhizobium sp. CG5]|uniref:AprI/Inh family metalloprotease inhibitor n=1 Tax=Rhizobium sp. CG5 TaxID=2726076 RepID=UPI002034557F|nr:AprI/Inh family metalloprotease inhibitor [Rhizobium sp. CG5]